MEINRPQANMLKEIGSLLPENAGMCVPNASSEHAYCTLHRNASTDTKIIVLTLTVGYLYVIRIGTKVLVGEL
jgi:hypothetical protein